MAGEIAAFATAQNAFNDQLDAAVDGIATDIKTLNDKITELQNSPGTITPADQKLLDDIQARTQALVARVTALDDLTPPPVPPS